MKGNCLKIAATLILVFGMFPAIAAFADKDDNEIKFTGTVTSLPSSGIIGDWVVSGTTVHVTGGTRIEQEDGPAVVGAVVKVEGVRRADGSVDATEVGVKESASGNGNGNGNGNNNGRGEAEFKGTIESFPAGFIGDWRIGGRTIHVTSATRIEAEIGPVAAGAFVEVKGSMRADGSIDATKIEVKSNVAGGDGRDEIKGTIESLPGAANFVGDWRV